jgi:oxygen-dependent protoporphyrinogen oxidase
VSSNPSIIIGGGISGLSAAYYLAQRGLPSVLIEPAPKLGGVMQTREVAGCLLEGGPDSFLAAKPEALELIRELGLGAEVIGSNDHQRLTWIVKGGRMTPIPDGLMMMVPTRVLPTLTSRLLSWNTKMRMSLELLRAPRPGVPDRSVGEFVEDHYGREAVDYLAEPLLSGVYGGDPYQLSIQSVLPRYAEMEARYGSLTKGTLASLAQAPPKRPGATLFQTLKGGLGSLVQALEQAVAPYCRVIRASAESVSKEDGVYSVRIPGATLSSPHLVVATPAWAAADLLDPLDAGLAQCLRRIGYSSSATVGVIYDRADVAQSFPAFGFLVPRRERRHLVACTFVDQKFNYRVPPDRLLLRCFLGGVGNEAILDASDEEIRAAVLGDLQALLSLKAKPIAVEISRWRRSMAQYHVGHQALLGEIEERLQAHPQLRLAGNGYRGIGIPDCIKIGKEAANSFHG